MVVARAVLNECDQIPVARAAAARTHLVENAADQLNDFDIAHLVAAADIVALADASYRGHNAPLPQRFRSLSPAKNAV